MDLRFWIERAFQHDLEGALDAQKKKTFTRFAVAVAAERWQLQTRALQTGTFTLTGSAIDFDSLVFAFLEEIEPVVSLTVRLPPASRRGVRAAVALPHGWERSRSNSARDGRGHKAPFKALQAHRRAHDRPRRALPAAAARSQQRPCSGADRLAGR